MDNHRRPVLVNELGQPFGPRVEDALVSLVPEFRRQFPVLCDDYELVEILEDAGRRIERRERQVGKIECLRGYAWVTLRSIAASRLRRGDSRLARRTLTAEDGEAAIDATPTQHGTPDQIEGAILLREVLQILTPAERQLCIMRRAGFSSQEIANRRGGTAAAVNMMLLRVRQKVRRLLGATTVGNSASAPTRTLKMDSIDLDVAITQVVRARARAMHSCRRRVSRLSVGLRRKARLAGGAGRRG